MNNFLRDLMESIKISPVWLFMAHQDIVARYRRTTLGPWWITIGTGLGLIGMAFVWSTLFSMNIRDIFPYVSSGFIIWMFISATLTESANIFPGAGGTLKTIKIPFLTFVFCSVLRNLYIMFHNAVIFLFVLVIFQVPVSFVTLLFLPGILLLFVSAFFVGVILAILGARFRDLSHIIGSLMTFIMLLTPIMWNANVLSGNKIYIAHLNPITHYISVIREPLLNKIPASFHYYFIFIIIIVLIIFSNYLYKRYSKKIIFWL